MPQCPEQQPVPDTVLFHTISKNLSPLLHLLPPNRRYVVRGLKEDSFDVSPLTVFDLQPLEPITNDQHDQLSQFEYVGD
jgi:hypothetical protein